MTGQALYGIAGFNLVTADSDRLVRFYGEVLGFALDAAELQISRAEMTLLGLTGSGRRRRLSLGTQTLSIDQFDCAGRAYPGDSNAASLWFQHLALVVTDMAAAWERLRHATPITVGGPQRLPASSGGVQAFKFRDPDGHPLELLAYPRNRTPAAWRGMKPRCGQIGLGIDHSAISVADVDASADYFRALGLRIGDRTVNRGPAQQCLDDVPNVVVHVVPVNPLEAPPHLEMLGYRQQHNRKGTAFEPNDVAATRIVWRGNADALIRDLDGHLHQIETEERSS